MPPILPVDWPALYTIIITALVGALFAFVGAAVKFYIDRKAAERAWRNEMERVELTQKKELEKIAVARQLELEKVELEWQHRLEEQKKQSEKEASADIRRQLTAGLDDAQRQIERQVRRAELLNPEMQHRPVQASESAPFDSVGTEAGGRRQRTILIVFGVILIISFVLGILSYYF